jgi:hypothetical protein
MRAMICVLSVLFGTSLAVAGEIFGTIVDGGKPVAEGTKIEVTIVGKSFMGATDKLGAYHVFASEKGKGSLTAYYKGQKSTVEVFSFEKATRYDYTMELSDGKWTLKRK